MTRHRCRRSGLLASLALLGLVLASCSSSQPALRSAPYRPGTGYPNPTSTPVTGFTLYERDCGWCHGNALQGTSYGPPLVGGTNGGALTDFMLATGRMPLTTPDQKDALHQHTIYTPAEMAALVQYVASFNASGPPVPALDLSVGSLTQGKLLYQANCAACHSATGTGGAIATGKPGVVNGFVLPRHGLVAPSLLQASSLEVAEAIRTGPPGMPNFSSSELSDTQVDEIARYVAYLKSGPNPGGANLGRIGPVAEGAIGWIVGLGLLLLLVRWIGTSGRQRDASHTRPGGAGKETC